ncbi:FecR family protein [Kovacikia minuta CCNUW1]|uniref:FecR family protein n=1 Tax=Kovacikia minuta TaxID=2931930 RepID=UPI001CCA11FF|nr:FecR domain-containing protein [Kovacikia minuta]UBF25241.1 FecR family protein [Kovacikia minuta CCNUW1]
MTSHVPLASLPLQVRVDRWLEIRQIVGSVFYSRQQITQPARVGMQLQQPGEGVLTAARSRTVLAVDTGIGFIDVAERTVLRVQKLQKLPDGGHITHLQVISGQARLRVRRFTHNSSELEIQTPAGWSAVRGTVFGLTVHPDGKTGLATREGKVTTNAQGKTVPVSAGFQNLTIPGEPPSPPVPIPLKPNTRLQLQILIAVSHQAARIVGRIDPVNLLIIGDQPQIVDRNGRFDLTVAMAANRRIPVVVITPLGQQQAYELAVP